MGKRELLLIVAFAVLGVIAYRVTAPAGREPGEPFSLARSLQAMVASIRGENTAVEVRREASTALTADTQRLVLTGFSGRIAVVGELRDDVVVEVSATVFGADQAQAEARADRLRVDTRVEGTDVVVELERPDGRRRPRLDVRLAVPARLTARIEAEGGRIEVQGLSGVALETRRIETILTDIDGPVSGEQRDGSVEVVRADAVTLTTRRASVRLEQVDGPITGEFTEGRLLVVGASSAITVETTRVAVEFERVAGPTRLVARDGRVTMRLQDGAVDVDSQRAPVVVTLGRGAPIAARSVDGNLDVTLAPDEGAVLDLEAEEGTVRVPDIDVTPSRDGTRTHLHTTLGDGGETVRLRTTRADIVVRR